MRYLLLPLMFLPTVALAAGGSAPASSTATTTNCTDGQVYDERAQSCVTPQESRLDDDTLYQAAREFAHAGAFGHAQQALAAMSNQTEDRVLTYWGYTHRNLGAWDLGLSYYHAALQQNPDNILARSYLGQAQVQAGDMAGALIQLREIQNRGGADTWAETSLKKALLTGEGYGQG
ncbi:MAG: tetratricopeptide repeat protein [Pseudomonadota bacterium]